jgi:drug/metabolite transporter (DMT)-like permease
MNTESREIIDPYSAGPLIAGESGSDETGDGSDHVRLYGIAMALLTAVLWGSLPIFLKLALNRFSTTFVVWCRFSVAFLALLLMLALTGKRPLQFLKRPPRVALVAAVFLLINYLLFLKGIHYSGAATAGVLIQTGGLILVGIGVVFFKEKLRILQVIGFLSAFLGLVVFCKDRSGLVASVQDYWLGSAYTLGAALAWALYAACLKAYAANVSGQLLNLVVFAVGSLCYLFVLDASEFSLVTPGYALLLLALGLNTFLGYAALTEALRAIPTAQAMVIITANPIITISTLKVLTLLEIGWVTAEAISPLGYAGAALAIGGVILVLRK